MQKHVDKSCMGAVVAALIAYSDQTSLSNDQRVSAWPLMLTAANIPLEQRGQPNGHVLMAVFQILKPVPGHPGTIAEPFPTNSAGVQNLGQFWIF